MSNLSGPKMRGALLREIQRYANPARGIDEGKALDAVVREVVKCAVDRKDPNFTWAVDFLANRIDGKATEHIQIDDNSSATKQAIGISAAFTLLGELTGSGQDSRREIDVSDRPLLLTPVRTEPDGRGETVGLRPHPGSSEKPQ